jgi:hypothetical protein
VQVLLLHCPGCEQPLVHYYGQSFRIDPTEFRYLREKGNMEATEVLVRPESPQHPILPPATHKAGEAVREKPVGADEILELHHTLEACETVEDFLRSLG